MLVVEAVEKPPARKELMSAEKIGPPGSPVCNFRGMGRGKVIPKIEFPIPLQRRREIFLQPR
jgi:hypothetical protein